VSELRREVKVIVRSKERLSIVEPEKAALFHRIKIPPEAVVEGTKSNLSKSFRANFLIKGISKLRIFVSCRHTMEQPLSSILFLTASCLLLAFRPLIF